MTRALKIVPEDRVAALVTRWHEKFFGVECMLLMTSPVYYGVNVPRGDGSAVILIPGFMHGDAYLIILYAWLTRIGYKPYYSGLELNADCPNLLIQDQLNAIVDRARKETGGKVHLVGHSLGGVIARSIAAQRPRDVASVITLGSAFQGSVTHRSIWREMDAVRVSILEKHGKRVRPECFTDRCRCRFMKALMREMPASVRQTAIFTRNDGAVDWRYCITHDASIDVEVNGTHAGLAFNPAVYSVIAERLATRKEKPTTKTRKHEVKV